jgi:hypothetical protein
LINEDGKSGEETDIMSKRVTGCERATTVGFEDYKRVTMLEAVTEGPKLNLRRENRWNAN